MQDTDTQQLRKGDLIVDNEGNLAMISRLDVQSPEPDHEGAIHIFHVGTIIRSNSVAPGSRWAGQITRKICSAVDLLKLLATKYDITTPAEKPDSQLTQIELLQKQVAQLQSALAKK